MNVSSSIFFFASSHSADPLSIYMNVDKITTLGPLFILCHEVISGEGVLTFKVWIKENITIDRLPFPLCGLLMMIMMMVMM